MHQEILKLWFEELEPKQWWVKDLELDQLVDQCRATQAPDREAKKVSATHETD